MEGILEILRDALPEAIGGLVAAATIGLLSYLFVKWIKKEHPQTIETHNTAPEPPAPEICANLPPRSMFIGREKEKARVREALNSRSYLICIDGIGGIGKTSLALEVAHECLRASKDDLFPEKEQQSEYTTPKFDGFIWTSAKDRELQLNDVLDAVARTLDWPGIAQQPVEEKRESVFKLLQTKRYLLIVDNFETVTDETVYDFLLKLPEPSKALITSREQKLRQAWAVSIKGLEQNEALILIRSESKRLGLKSVEEAEDQVLLHLFQATGGAPLAIKWAVGQIKQRGQSLDTVLEALHQAKGDIFEDVFARSWSLLSENARKVLMVMPIFASSASKDAIEAASDVHHFELDEALGQLVQMWLVEVTDELEAAKRRYSVHPLTRAFSGTYLRKDKQFNNEARKRATQYYIEFAKRYGGTQVKKFDFLEVERENMFRIIDWCFGTDQLEKGLKIIKKMLSFLRFRGYWQEQICYAKYALKAAKQIGDEELAEILVNPLGWIYVSRGDYEEAKQYLKQGLVEARKVGMLRTIGHAKRYFGWIAKEHGNLEEARLLINKALEIAEKENYESFKYALYSDLGEIELKYKNYGEAESWYRKAKAGLENLNRKARVAKRLVLLGDVLLLQNKLNESKKAYQESLAISQEYKRKDHIARAKLGLSKLSEIRKNYSEALRLANEALTDFKKLGMKKYIEEAQAIIERLKKNLS